MSQPLSVLIVDDDEVFRNTLADQLRRDFPDLRTAVSGATGLRAVEQSEPDVMLLDLNLGDADGLDVLNRVREVAPSTEVIVVTGFGSVDAAVEAMRRGACDFVTKPLRLEALVASIQRAGERRQLRRENAGLRHMLADRDEGELVGSSQALAQVREFIAQAARSDAPVLISGPSGSGKELVARAIHRGSPRAKRPMLVVNCAALHENLLESELFGHERGAFTGADRQRQGLVETAHRSTLFLDEVGELPIALQAKLLRAIQFGEVRRVGGVTNLRVDVRFLAATNRRLDELVREGGFREDLYYRLNVLSVRIPPLAERPADVEDLFAHTAARIGLTLPTSGLSDAQRAVLRGHPWQGNVRELENLVERIKIRGDDAFPDAAQLRALLDPVPPDGSPLPGVRPLAEVERAAIEGAVEYFDGDRKRAADALGISVRTLYYRLSQWRTDEGGKPDDGPSG